MQAIIHRWAEHLLSGLRALRSRITLRVGLLLLALLLVGGLIVASGMGRDDAQAAPKGGGGGGVRSPESIFAARSPGARARGVLLQIKKHAAPTQRLRPRALPAPPRSRVLSGGRVRPPLAPPYDFSPAIVLGLPEQIFTVPGVIPAAWAGTTNAPIFDVPPAGFGEAPGPVIDAQPPPPGPAVPEPATWLMLIVGLGLIGHTLRARSARSDGALAG